MPTIDPAVDPAIDFRIREFLKALNSSGGKPMETMSPHEAREVLVGAQKSVKLDLPPCDVTPVSIDHQGQSLELVIVRPAGVTTVLPAFMFFHGGGWVLGDFATHERLVRDLVVESGAAAVFVNYTPSPEAHFPVAIEQAYAATKWVADSGRQQNLDGKRLAVVGNSVGGNMAAVVALMAKDRGGPSLRLQVLLWPVTAARFDTASYLHYAEGRFLTRNMMMWFWDHYTTNPEERASIYASPLRAETEQLRGLPPAWVTVAENDVLRDEGEAYARKLNDAGVDVTAVRYNGMIHDWGLLNPLSHVPGVRSTMLQVGAELKKYLR